MGEPAQGNAWASHGEYIAVRKATRGTETSKYPEEEKETSIPLVAASERGRGQTMDSSMGLRTPITHGVGSRTCLERQTAGGKSPVGGTDKMQGVSRVGPDTCNPA